MFWSVFQPRRADRRPSRKTFAPVLERLEDRTVPSTIPVLGTGSSSGSVTAKFGTVDPGSATWYLRSSATAGAPDAGSFQYGAPGWVPLAGDWKGTGSPGIGAYDPKTATWYLRSSASAGAPDVGSFQFGMPGWVPLVGDWNGSGHTGIGAYDPSTGTFYLRNDASAGAPDAGTFQFGAAGWKPLAGDWGGSGKDGIGAYDPSTGTFYLRNSASPGAADAGQFQYGAAGWQPLAGDWGGAGHAGIGAYDPTTGTFYLRNEAGAGAADAGTFQYGVPGWQPVAGVFPSASNSLLSALSTQTPSVNDPDILTLNLNPLDIKLLGLEVQTSQITVHVSSQTGQGQLLGNLLTDVSSLLNLQGVNNALNNVLGSVVTLLNSVSLNVGGVNTNTGPLSSAPAADTPVLDVFVAPVHLNLLGALVDTSPIHLTITAHSGPGLVLGNVITDLANLFNPPLPNKLDINFINGQLQKLLGQLNAQLTGLGISPVTTTPVPAGTDRVLSLALPPINLNLLGLNLKTSQIQANVDAQTGNGELLGNVITDLLNTLNATPQNLSDLSNNLNALLAQVVGVLNASSLILPSNAVSSLSQVLQTLALPNLVNSSGTASAPILNLAIASTDGTTPPVDVNLLGVVVTTSNIQAQLIAQTGDGQILGNLLYNVANLLNPGGSLNLLTVLDELGL